MNALQLAEKALKLAALPAKAAGFVGAIALTLAEYALEQHRNFRARKITIRDRRGRKSP
jgi:O-acetyl-ADP-ribose deacetylase (regulator of RNase III)